MGTMAKKIAIGGGSGAVVTSAHAGCERFRGTDPLITGQTRRNLAKTLGAKDTVGSISEARWTRAKTFETLVHDAEFAGRIVASAVGGAGLPKPDHCRFARRTGRRFAHPGARAAASGQDE